MTQSQLIQVKNNTITLPKTLMKTWKGKDVYVRFSDDAIFIKKLQPPSLWELRDQLRTVAKTITQKDINNAVTWARKKRSQKTA